jgi:cholesterol transport system auxiliary component
MTRSIGKTLLGALWAANVALATNACALTSKAEVVDVRYFNPERINPRINRATLAATPQTTIPTLQLRLGRVSSGPNLRERIAYRNSAYEQGYYEDLQWTERPEIYVRHELGRSLFEAHAFRRVLTGAAPTLDVELIAFDEVRLKASRVARIQLKVILYEDEGVLFEDTLTIDRPVMGEKPTIEDVVEAMATALDSASEQVATRVQQSLVAKQVAPFADALQ